MKRIFLSLFILGSLFMTDTANATTRPDVTGSYIPYNTYEIDFNYYPHASVYVIWVKTYGKSKFHLKDYAVFNIKSNPSHRYFLTVDDYTTVRIQILASNLHAETWEFTAHSVKPFIMQ